MRGTIRAACTAAIVLVPAGFAFGEARTAPDEAPRPVSDFDGSGVVTGRDMYAFANSYFLGELEADMNGNGLIDLGDFLEFADAWVTGR